MWFCQHKTHSDGGVEDWTFDVDDLERTRRELQIELSKLDHTGFEAESKSKGPVNDNESQGIYDLWHRLVGAYSRRALTWPSDKLPAISAVAMELSRLTNGDYLAGLWRANLPRDLLWTTHDSDTTRPKTWRAPTWSWASINDHILYKNPPPENATLLAKILDVQTVPSTSLGEFGELNQGGSLLLTAPSSHAKLDNEDDRYEWSRPWLTPFNMDHGTSERELLLDMHSRSSATEKNVSEDTVEPKDAKPSEEEPFGPTNELRLPDEVFIVFIYGQRHDVYRSFNTAVEEEDTAQQWLMWGLMLKKVTDSPAGEQLYERVMSFSQLKINFMTSFFPLEEEFRII